jgi:hypothetical protein
LILVPTERGGVDGIDVAARFVLEPSYKPVMSPAAYQGICRQYAHLVDEVPAGIFPEKQDAWALIQAVMMEANVVINGEAFGKFGAIEYWLRNAFRQAEVEDRLLFFMGGDADVCRMASDQYERHQRNRKRYGLNSTIVLGRPSTSPLRLALGDLRIQLRLPAASEPLTSMDLILHAQAKTTPLTAKDLYDYQEFLVGVGFTDEARKFLTAVVELDAFLVQQTPEVPATASRPRQKYYGMKTAEWVMAARWMKGAAAMEGRLQVDANDFSKLAYALRPGFFEVSPELKAAMAQESWYPRIASYLKP